jgi:hypothetical protein
MTQPHQLVRLKVVNMTELPWRVSFEPMGDQAELPPGEMFAVEISGPGDGLVEVCVAKPSRLIIGEWDGAVTRVKNVRGEIVETY